MIALAILVCPVALFGLFHKTRLHYVGIQILDAKQQNRWELLKAIKTITGRSWLRTGGQVFLYRR